MKTKKVNYTEQMNINLQTEVHMLKEEISDLKLQIESLASIARSYENILWKLRKLSDQEAKKRADHKGPYPWL